MSHTAANITIVDSNVNEVRGYVKDYLGEPFIIKNPKSILDLFIEVVDLTYELNYTKKFLIDNKISEKEEEDEFSKLYDVYEFNTSIDFTLKTGSVLKDCIMNIVFNIALDLSEVLKKKVLVFSGNEHTPYVAIESGKLTVDLRNS